MEYVSSRGASECQIVPTVDTCAHPARGRQLRKQLERDTVVVVAISGLHGAGKTTAARAIAKKFKLRYICAGAVFRQLAKEHGMTLDEFSRHAERHPKIDRAIDRRTAEAAKGDNVLIDARLAGWIAKRADLKILLTAPVKIRAKRISKRERRSYRSVLRETVKRERSEAKRFKRFYGIDINDCSPFDIVLSTERLSAREMVRILEFAVGVVLKRRS